MTNIFTRLDQLDEYVMELERRIVEAERMNENLMRMGRVMEVDPQKGTVVVSWGKDENDQWVEGPEIPWVARAGKIRDWNPPSVGEQVMVFSPGGEIGSDISWCMPGGFCRQFPRNHNKEGERRIQIGDTEILITKDGITLKGGKIKIIGKELDIKADKIKQDKKGDKEEMPDPVLPPVTYPTAPPPDLVPSVPTS